jgi:hypothetical protein
VLGFTSHAVVRYIGTYFAPGAYVSNWAATNAYQSSNIVGHGRGLPLLRPLQLAMDLEKLQEAYL